MKFLQSSLFVFFLLLVAKNLLSETGRHSCPQAVRILLESSNEVVTPVAHREIEVNFPGIQFASLEDSTGATGATMFYFPHGASAVYDARGGSVASTETTLLDPGSYSNIVDAILFAGGSTMGLEATSGARARIFESRAELATAFDSIASVPGAVVYDYGARSGHQDPMAYPNYDLGYRLFDHLSNNFKLGRAGAGLNVTANKGVDSEGVFYGGQGLAFIHTPQGSIMAAVILNPGGNVFIDNVPAWELVENAPLNLPGGIRPGANTTLSFVATDIPLDRNQLQRLSTMVHTSMAEHIRPFQTYGDGDINFAASVQQSAAGFSPQDFANTQNSDVESWVQEEARGLMKQAIERAFRAANADPLKNLVHPRINIENAYANELPVALVQYFVEGNLTRNKMLEKIDRYFEKAQSAGAELIIFPELFVFDLVKSQKNESEELARIAQSESDFLFDYFALKAKETNIATLVGSLPRKDTDENAIYNTAMLAFPNGRKVFQDKIYITPEERFEYHWKAGNSLRVFDTPWGRSTILICHDCEFPNLSSELASVRPELIFVPSMTGSNGLGRVRNTAAARSIEQHAYTLVTGVTDLRGKDFSSQSVIFTPHDTSFTLGIAAELPANTEDILFHRLDMARLRQSRARYPNLVWPGAQANDAPSK